jgi:hypothetical protein
MVRADKKQILEELYHLQNCALALGEFYHQLASIFYDEKWFWEEAVADQVNHARKIGQLVAMVATNEEHFLPGKYRVDMLRLFLDGVYENIKLINDRKLPRPAILRLCLEYEKSPIAAKPFDAVKSYEKSFYEFSETFETEISTHSQRIIAYVKGKLDNK